MSAHDVLRVGICCDSRFLILCHFVCLQARQRREVGVLVVQGPQDINERIDQILIVLNGLALLKERVFLVKPFGTTFGLDIIWMGIGHHIHKEDGILLILVARLIFRHRLISGIVESLVFAHILSHRCLQARKEQKQDNNHLFHCFQL